MISPEVEITLITSPLQFFNFIALLLMVFFNAGYTKCKIKFSSISGTQSTGRLEIRRNGNISVYHSDPGPIEFELAKGDYIAGYVIAQNTFRFSASVTMSL